jgi:hypothetical protein
MPNGRYFNDVSELLTASIFREVQEEAQQHNTDVRRKSCENTKKVVG